MIPITQFDLRQREILALILNLIVTLCTESIGFVHGISLRSALTSESRLHFNTNLRLLTAARGWYNPNGTLLNGIMTVLLIVSYTSSSIVLCYNIDFGSYSSDVTESIAIAGLPLLSLGVALLLQVVITLSGMRAVKILTWSSSPFDLTAALVYHAHLTPVTFRCMRCVSDRDVDGGPAKPSVTQPSAWHAHPSIRKVVISLWGIVIAYAGWAALIMYIWDKYPSTRMSTNPPLPTWSFFPNRNPSSIAYTIPDFNMQGWILIYVNLAIVQAPLTLGLHCSELIANVIQDERQWRCATRKQRIRVATNPLKSTFTHLVCLVLFLAKPFLHWMFGLSFFVDGLAGDETVEKFVLGMYVAQIWNLCIALFVIACFFTLFSLHRPRGPQPATYGHIQTLANLVDEWSPVMWWGHKQGQIPYCHAGMVLTCLRGSSIEGFAGTSDHPLPDVKMDSVYAGFGIESPASVS
ncbi:hypothetical protein F4604DRAFT_1586942 [Suillus subluteus]|nr:hypothetical protein F4604DRAFT_1586942 [Suillus subluteus]